MSFFFYVVSWHHLFLTTPSHSETDEGCKKQMERLLNIWKERSLYRADYIQQLKLAIEDNNSPIQRGSGTENGSHTMIVKFLSKNIHDLNAFLQFEKIQIYFPCVNSAEEKVPVKRSYQKIQEDEEDEDDDYRSHVSPRNTGSSATQLVGCHSVTWFQEHVEGFTGHLFNGNKCSKTN